MAKRNSDIGPFLFLGAAILLITVGPNLIMQTIARIINPSGAPMIDQYGNRINYTDAPLQ